MWGALGAARACYESALEYAKTRVQFDKPIAAFQLTQEKLVNMMLEINKGLLVALHVGRLKDAGQARTPRTCRSASSTTCASRSRSAARRARSWARAASRSSIPVIRHCNNLESVLTYEGTSEIHTLILGQAITGENAFS